MTPDGGLGQSRSRIRVITPRVQVRDKVKVDRNGLEGSVSCPGSSNS